MARQKKGTAPAAHVEDLAKPGPITRVLDQLIASSLRPRMEAAKADVVRTEDEYARAVELNTVNPTNENLGHVRATYVAKETAPTILLSAESAFKNVQALRDSEEVREADRELTESEGTRTAFAAKLDTLQDEVEQHAARLAQSLAHVHQEHAMHAQANAQVKGAVESIAAKLKTFHLPVDLAHALGRGALDTFDSRQADFASARAVKSGLATTLGRERAYRFYDALRVVS